MKKLLPRTCNFCLSDTYDRQYIIDASVLNKTVYYHRCGTCGSILQAPLPDEEELSSYYENYRVIKAELNPGYLDETAFQTLASERDKTLAEIGFQKENLKNAVNVELGCANGLFLRYLAENGSVSTIGIDRSQHMLDSIKAKNIRLIKGSLKDIEAGSADNIFLFNVLEHIPDTGRAMRDLVRAAKNTSKIIIEVPLSGYIQNRFGSKWRFLMADEHLNIPSLEGLKILLSRYGLRIIGSTRFGSGFTSGMIGGSLKRTLDFLAKKMRFGDRGSFLIERTS